MTFVKEGLLAAPVSGGAHTDSDAFRSGRNKFVSITSQNLLILEWISYSEPMKPDCLVSSRASSLLLSEKCLLGTFWSSLGSTLPQKDADAARDHSTAFFPISSKKEVVGVLFNTDTLCQQRLPTWPAHRLCRSSRRGAATTSSDRRAASAFAPVMGSSYGLICHLVTKLHR